MTVKAQLLYMIEQLYFENYDIRSYTYYMETLFYSEMDDSVLGDEKAIIKELAEFSAMYTPKKEVLKYIGYKSDADIRNKNKEVYLRLLDYYDVDELSNLYRELPIPRHLQKYFTPRGHNNHENQANGTIRCDCTNETFRILSSNHGGIVRLRCTSCDSELSLFDAGKHGWNGYVCGDDLLDRTEALQEHCCPDCGKTVFSVSVTIFSQGKQDFLDECVRHDDTFTPEDWIDSFAWIQISPTCASCRHQEEHWVDYETM